MNSPVRTRFAPSPTGFLHLGGARTALFAWAYARRHRGCFILRIEDTDVARSTPEAVQAILDAIQWLGLDYDEGPYYQMQRMDRYRAAAAELLERGLAYRCYMQPDALERLRAEQMARGEKPRYDGRWRPENALGQAPPPGVAPVLRFKNPQGGSVVWDDRVKGRIEIANAELDDLVIARPDGTPTYNFCAVVDDLDMRITHVIRGDDHVNNTPRQINMIRAFGAEPPVYAHVPTVLGEDGHKLSKRHGAVSVMQYEEMGYLPEAMLNFLARLGWSHGDDEIFAREQLIAWFDLDNISPSPSRFDTAKLKWVNQAHMKALAPEELGRRLVPFLARAGLDHAAGPAPGNVAALLRERAATLVGMADAAHYFYSAPRFDARVLAGVLSAPLGIESSPQQRFAPVRPAFEDILKRFAEIPWSRDAIAKEIKAAASRHGLAPPQVMMPLRVLVCGTPQTPAIDAVLELIGRGETVRRLGAGLSEIAAFV